MHYTRKSIQPSIPKNLSDIHKTLNNFKTKTNREKDFLLINNSINNIIIFSTTENFKFLNLKIKSTNYQYFIQHLWGAI